MAGERIARWCLVRHGVEILDANVRVGRGELDLIGVWRGRRVAFEVRTAGPGRVPTDAFDDAKRAQVADLARQCGIGRVDLVAIGFDTDVVTVAWVPRVV